MALQTTRVGETLARIGGKKVLVAGDVILDRFESGEVLRLSREAPVPVLKKTRQHDVPGGAANVAMNIVSLGGQARLVGVCGNDGEALALKSLLDDNSVEHRIVSDPGRPTTLKTRFAHKNQQFLRLDREVNTTLDEEFCSEAAASFVALARDCDCVVFSDYSLGFFTPSLASVLVKEVRKLGIPLVVDPRPEAGYLCRDCDVLVPGKPDGILLSGQATGGDLPGDRVAALLVEKYGNSVVVTDGSNGMYIATTGGETAHISSRAEEIFDVSGAGDTVAAAISLGLAAGCSLMDAATLANEAAGIVVAKFGTSVAYPGDIMERSGEKNKIMDHVRLRAALEEARLLGSRIVFTNGCFDLLHHGHINYLKASRALGDLLVVALNSDASVRRLKGPDRPLISQWQRADLIASLEFVDYVTLFEEDTPGKLIASLEPDVFAKGGDYTEETLPEAPLVRSYGGEVRLVPIFGNGISTTGIIEKISGTGNCS